MINILFRYAVYYSLSRERPFKCDVHDPYALPFTSTNVYWEEEKENSVYRLYLVRHIL
jgi:hypothetical protein